MTDAEEFIYSTYMEVKDLSCSNTSKVSLVRSSFDEKYYIRRILPGNHLSVYKKIKELSLPCIPQLFEILYDGNTIVFEEYIEGTSLSMINEFDFTTIMIEILYCLNSIHKNNIIHLDIKEDNFLVSADGRVILIDFAIAQLCCSKNDVPNAVVGTIGYAAPEQFGISTPDIRSDLYSFGKLCDSLLNKCNNLSPTDKQMWQTIIRKATSFQPEERYQNAHEILYFVNHPELFFGKTNERLLSFPHMTPPLCMHLAKGETKTTNHVNWGEITVCDANNTTSLTRKKGDIETVFTIFSDAPVNFTHDDYVIELTFLFSHLLITRKFFTTATDPFNETFVNDLYFELRQISNTENNSLLLGNRYQSLLGFSILGKEESILDKETLISYPL